MFPTALAEIEDRIQAIDPVRYAKTRNFKDGAVTRLSPYISRGVISTRQVLHHLQSLDLSGYQVEKLIQELAWRDYWQQVWIAKGDAIFGDLKSAQQPVDNHEIPQAIVAGTTTIEAVDRAIEQLYATGYMHNHMRMYVASLCCNIARSHWLQPAKWMYGHLLGGDLASNHLSWQWVAGSNANKKYYANQDNINKYFDSRQKGTFLDVSYEEIDRIPIPEELNQTVAFDLQTPLPDTGEITLENKQTLIYNYYNLDPYWHQDEEVQRVLLLEPAFFAQHPVSKQCIDFILQLAKNIPNIQVFVGSFEALNRQVDTEWLIYKEHPTNRHYQGTEEPREWMFAVSGYFSSFFKFWKKCKKQLR